MQVFMMSSSVATIRQGVIAGLTGQAVGDRYNGSDGPGHTGNRQSHNQPTSQSTHKWIYCFLWPRYGSAKAISSSSKVDSHHKISAPKHGAFFETIRLETLAANRNLKFCETAIEKLVPPNRRLTVCSKNLRPLRPLFPRAARGNPSFKKHGLFCAYDQNDGLAD
jgi:hypothetical protein